MYHLQAFIHSFRMSAVLPPVFKLERFFAQYQFCAKYLGSCSDGETIGMQELLNMADDECKELWENMMLCYTGDIEAGVPDWFPPRGRQVTFQIAYRSLGHIILTSQATFNRSQVTFIGFKVSPGHLLKPQLSGRSPNTHLDLRKVRPAFFNF